MAPPHLQLQNCSARGEQAGHLSTATSSSFSDTTYQTETPLPTTSSVMERLPDSPARSISSDECGTDDDSFLGPPPSRTRTISAPTLGLQRLVQMCVGGEAASQATTKSQALGHHLELAPSGTGSAGPPAASPRSNGFLGVAWPGPGRQTDTTSRNWPFRHSTDALPISSSSSSNVNALTPSASADSPRPVPSLVTGRYAPTPTINTLGTGKGVSNRNIAKGMELFWPRGVRKAKGPVPAIQVSVSELGPGKGGIFAQEVAILGWQIVGGKAGKDFLEQDRGKVGAYVVYEIEITLRTGSTVSIMRRYTEFERLRSDLRSAFPHLRKTIPALPSKNSISKFSPAFLEERRPRLQRFLRTVMLHPEMGVGGDHSIVGRWVLGSR